MFSNSIRYRICRKGGVAIEWNVTEKYEIIEFVGEGSFGQVCRARQVCAPAPGSAETVVIKRIVDIFHVRRSWCSIACLQLLGAATALLFQFSYAFVVLFQCFCLFRALRMRSAV